MFTPDGFFRYAGSTTLAASMLLSACGGSDNPAAPSQQPTPDVSVVPVAQPAWGSLGVLVPPGQANLRIELSGCQASLLDGGYSSDPMFDASVTILANGDVSFVASKSPGASVAVSIGLLESNMTLRESSYSADSAGLTSARLSAFIREDMSVQMSSSSKSGFTIRDIDNEIRCDAVPLATLTPAPAFLPSEARAASALLAGVTGVEPSSVTNQGASIIGGAFYWRNSWQDSSAENLTPGSSINLSNGQLFNGYNYNPASGFAANPAPQRITFSGALTGGGYGETYYAATNSDPEARYVRLRIDNPSAASFNYDLTRLGNSLFVGDYFD